MSISAAVVQHLGVLETAGIVDSEKVGRVRVCPARARQACSPADTWLARAERSQWSGASTVSANCWQRSPAERQIALIFD